jgi:hypothetical protein
MLSSSSTVPLFTGGALLDGMLPLLQPLLWCLLLLLQLLLLFAVLVWPGSTDRRWRLIPARDCTFLILPEEDEERGGCRRT